MVNSREIVSIVELIFYIPTTVVALVVCARHGFRQTSGWIYTVLLCVARVAGAICHLIGINNPSVGVITASVIIDSLGLSPLLLATLGLLSRFVDFIHAHGRPVWNPTHFRLLQTIIIVGLILAIVGGTNGKPKPDGSIQVQTTSKVGIILYIVGYAGIVAVLVVSARQTNCVPKKERRVPVAVFFALPFLLVRLVYAACAVFLHNHIFNIVTGSVPVWVVMSVIEEFIVVVTYVTLGFLVDKLDKADIGAIQGRKNKRQLNFGLVGMVGRGRRNRGGHSSAPHDAQETGYTGTRQ
ncbi:hypothetical protein EJ04DRAFT_488009 [Polyplosphaeria fusca]|uniref:DUF7702 domain-containing protein n=1 Tax=Polyplosphaeria fusca TaxID=682080 RepID=A0A9P4R5K4_9PLEO|nr:hypothetical protein EJ04DRAFT_488009 [Polyplosphaeria fusca]